MSKFIKYKKSLLLLMIPILTLSFVISLNNNPLVHATVPYTTTRVNLDSSGNEADSSVPTSSAPSSSKDGTFVAFASNATNLVASDTNGRFDIFVKNTVTGSIERVSVSTAGAQSNNESGSATISYDGRYVIFWSLATNLVASDTNAKQDVFLRDRQLGTTEMISLNTSGNPGNNHSGDKGISVSRNGRFVAFSSQASDLVASDSNAAEDVFIRDRLLGTTNRISVDSTGTQSNGISRNVSMSCDGAIVAFTSTATNLVPSDTNGFFDTFVVNRIGGSSIKDITISGNGSSGLNTPPAVSCDGSTVAFQSGASNLVASDTNAKTDVFIYDVSGAAIERASVDSSGNEGNNIADGDAIGLSGDGRYVAFSSAASNLVASDTNVKSDTFLRDRVAGVTEIVSKRNSTTQTNQHSYPLAFSPDGSTVFFVSLDSGLVAGDTNGALDLFKSLSGTVGCSL